MAAKIQRLAAGSRLRAVRASERLKLVTPRQRQVLDGMVDGLLNKQIAIILGISELTVKMHRASLLKSLGVRSSAAAIKTAVEASFLRLG